jgi:hypothetical protein
MNERVAIIAVHGVGDHQPMSTSSALARQLLHFYPSAMGTLECTPLHIPVDASELRIPDDQPPDELPPSRAAKLKKSVGSRASAYAAAHPSHQTADIRFTDMTLSCGAGHTGFYSTTRMRGSFSHAKGETRFDLYEMYWSDLSHGGIHGGFAVLSQLVQIFLHIASLGRSAIATILESLQPGEAPPSGLGLLNKTAAWGYWLLAMPIALGNLLLLDLGVAMLAHLVPNGNTGWIGASALVGVIMATALGILLSAWLKRAHTAPNWLRLLGMPLILILSITYATAMSRAPAFAPPGTVVFFVALPLLIFGTTLLVRQYDRSRPGALMLWRTMVGLLIACGLVLLWLDHQQPVESLAVVWHFHLAECVFAMLVVVWGALYLNNVALFLAVCLCRWHTAKEPIRQAVDTSLIAATIPAPLLLTVVLTLWGVAWETLAKFDFQILKTEVQSLLLGGDSAALIQHMQTLIERSAGGSFIPYLLVLALALLCVLTALLPSVFAEVKPRADRDNPAATRGMWQWLNQGFGFLHWAKWLCAVGFIFVIPAGIVLQYFDQEVFDLPHLGEAMGGSILAFIALTKLAGVNALGNVARFFSRLRVLIDTLIDVDNWLRERPVGDTPRLHIMARYTSLLHHLDKQGYKRVILVCHSQGTVITADLLRYLKARNPALLERLKRIDLLTLGSPLRQLYAARFPGIYNWANDARHEEAGLASWSNGYGSGDYVGRNLWKAAPHADSSLCTPGRDPARKEFCTGAIAHTHYFDEDSPEVAAAVAALLAGP